ncbi:Hypothetical protein FKW44_004626 [Caligus rogercresseyi]|uniref:Uncharacterized protein n=1 Tax=Caligus rogercresseyi TaxID=217165 RepID=A0A7T8HLW1_CALRO|nr:Hypothetical protein FKW44_004626 [Caligus rogercresseyi]
MLARLKKIAENGQRLFTIIDEATQRVSTSTGENEGNKQQVGGDQDEVLQEPTGENEGTNKLEGIKLRFVMDLTIPPLKILILRQENLTMVL